MSKLSPIPLKEGKTETILDDLWGAIASLESREEIKTFFFDLLTHTERKMLAKRFQVAVMLLEGCSYPVIKFSLQVTDHTIAKINNWLKTGATGLFDSAQRLAKQRGGQTKERKREGGRYLAGDLLLPAIDAGIDLVDRQLKKRRKRKKLLQE